MRNFLDLIFMEPYPLNHNNFKLIHLLNLILLFVPPFGFVVSMFLIKNNFMFINISFYAAQSPVIIQLTQFNIENNIILFIMFIVSGLIATAGGIFDWLFHRTYLTVSYKEHRAHLWALLCGNIIFICMILASITLLRHYFFLPIILLLIITTVLICYDEFLFHKKRCRRLETMFHRMLVFGNGTAFFLWFSILYNTY